MSADKRVPEVDFFFSFRSPYSYLAAPRAFALPRRFALQLRFRGVRPMVTRGVPLPLAKKLHILIDADREAARLGMPFAPVFDPLGAGALRCLYVAEHAIGLGRVEPFVLAASRAIWAEGRDVADDAVLRQLCEVASIDWTGARAALDDPELHAEVEQNIERLRALGHWGVPTLAWNGQTFWGQDRIDDFERALYAAGVPTRDDASVTAE